MDRRTYRRLDQCAADSLWSEHGSAHGQLPRTGRRQQAIRDVLCRLPPEPYSQLRQQAGRFQWYVPDEHVLGQVYPLPATYDPSTNGTPAPHARLLYLSPTLEHHDAPVVVTIVAHELAHIILDHDLYDLDGRQSAHQESEVRAAMRMWGFQVDADRADMILFCQVLQAAGLAHPRTGVT